MSLAYPLHWPLRQPRTAAGKRRRASNFKRSMARACQDVEHEVRMMQASGLVVSSNVELRIDGFPRSGRVAPGDPGVAVYFTRKGVQLVFACDAYGLVEQNLQAIAMHLEAMRGMERWGVGTLDQAFAGYQALPETAGEDPWFKVLGLEDAPRSTSDLQEAYRAAARRAHPDTGGSHDAFVRVQRAFEQGRRAMGGAA